MQLTSPRRTTAEVTRTWVLKTLRIQIAKCHLGHDPVLRRILELLAESRWVDVGGDNRIVA